MSPAIVSRRNGMSIAGGFTLVEVLLVVLIIGILVGGASMYYGDVISKAREDKALAEVKQLRKIIIKYESEQRTYITTYDEISEYPPERDLNKLVQLGLTPEVPKDPWGMDYRIDLAEGLIFSCGPDNQPYTADDVWIRFRPEFKPTGARMAGRSMIMVEFSRPLKSVLVSDFSVSGSMSGAKTVHAAAVSARTRYEVRLSTDFLSPGETWSVTVTPGATTPRSVDGGELSTSWTLVVEE